MVTLGLHLNRFTYFTNLCQKITIPAIFAVDANSTNKRDHYCVLALV